MPHYCNLSEDKKLLRRTVADALEVLCKEAGLGGGTRQQIVVAPIRLPSGKPVAVINLRCPTDDDLVFLVSLPTSATFYATRPGASQREELDISSLTALPSKAPQMSS
jgi:hypothetical protein